MRIRRRRTGPGTMSASRSFRRAAGLNWKAGSSGPHTSRNPHPSRKAASVEPKPEQDVTLTVSEAGWLSTFQDLGREDSEYLGVPCGGAADQHSAAVANILVGNRRGAALLEIMGGRFAFTPSHD